MSDVLSDNDDLLGDSSINLDSETSVYQESPTKKTNKRTGNCYRFQRGEIVKLCQVRIELEESHFNKIDIPLVKAWDAVVEKLNFPGLDRNTVIKRWKNCTQDYRQWKRPPSTGAGNSNLIHQKEPKEWVKVLDDFYRTRDTHNPPYLYDTAATQPERLGEKTSSCLDDVVFGGAIGLVSEKDKETNEKDNLESVRKKKKKSSIEDEVYLAGFLKAQMGQNDRAVRAPEEIAGAIRSLVELFGVNRQPQRSSRYHFSDGMSSDDENAPRY